MTNTNHRFKVKVWGARFDEVQAALEAIRSIWAPNVATSAVMRSGQGGYQAFLTVYLEVRR